MKRMALLFSILGVGQVYGMELPKQRDYQMVKLSPIALPQIYCHLSESMLPEIAQTIFSLQLKANGIDLVNKPVEFVEFVEKLRHSCGYDLTIKICEQFLQQAKISISDIKDTYNQTPLHFAVHSNPMNVKILIKIAGDDIVKSLTTKAINTGTTVLHWVARFRNTETVKFFLDAAGDKARMLLAMQDTWGQTPLHLAMENENTEMYILMVDTIVGGKNLNV